MKHEPKYIPDRKKKKTLWQRIKEFWEFLTDLTTPSDNEPINYGD